MLRRVLFFSLGLALFCFAGNASAAFYDVSVRAEDVTFIPQDLLVGVGMKIYATISNNGERDVEGTVRFYDGDALIGAKLFSVRAGARPEDTWVSWMPQVYGEHTLRIVVDNDGAFTDAVPVNNAIALPIFIDRDTDRDGVPDRSDDDRDNDLVLNSDEARQGTDAMNADTDGDGVNDRLDLFPLDPLRTKAPVQANAPLKPVTTPKPVVKTVPPSAVPTRPASIVVQQSPVVNRQSVQEIITPVQEQPADLVPEATTTVSLPVNSPSSTTDVPRLESETVHAASTDRAVKNTSSGSLMLGAAAALSAATAGFFIWLGRRV